MVNLVEEIAEVASAEKREALAEMIRLVFLRLVSPEADHPGILSDLRRVQTQGDIPPAKGNEYVDAIERIISLRLVGARVAEADARIAAARKLFVDVYDEACAAVSRAFTRVYLAAELRSIAETLASNVRRSREAAATETHRYPELQEGLSRYGDKLPQKPVTQDEAQLFAELDTPQEDRLKQRSAGATVVGTQLAREALHKVHPGIFTINTTELGDVGAELANRFK